MWNRKELLWLLTFAYVGFAQWASTWWSNFPLCIIVSEDQSAKDQSGNNACATLFEGIVRFAKFTWGEYVNHDTINAFGTILIAIFTWTLWRSTDKLWKAGEQQFRLARDEFNSTHRPKIRIKHVWLIGDDIWHDEPITVRVVCVNHGTTDAVVTDYGMQYHVVGEGKSLPPDHNIPPIVLKGGFHLQPGISLALPDFSDAITSEQHFGIRNGKARLCCLGFLHYLDGVKRLRTTAFCRVLTIGAHQNIGRFTVVTDEPDYEYED
jgi:hypothetical protein